MSNTEQFKHITSPSRKTLLSLLEKFPDALFVVDDDATILYANTSAQAMTGVTREDLFGKPLWDSAPWLVGASLYQAVQSVRQTREPTDVEYVSSITNTWLRVSLSPTDEGLAIFCHEYREPQHRQNAFHCDANQQIEYLICAGRDITERKQVEEERRWLVDAILRFIWMARPDGSITYNNQRLIDYLAMLHEQTEGNDWMAAVHPDDLQHVREVWQTLVQRGVPYEVEQRVQDGTSGAQHWLLVRGEPQRDAQGEIHSWIGTCTNIDEQKRAEERVRASEQNFRMLAETVPQLIWTISPDGRLEYANQRYCDWMQADLTHRGDDFWRQCVHPEDIERALMLRHHSLETGEPYENECRFKNRQTGEYHWFLIRGLPVRDEAGQILKWFGTSTDIDEQKRTEEALRQSQERASVLMNSSIIGIFLAEGEQVVDANETFLGMTGYSCEDLRTGNVNWMQMTPPEDVARTLQAHQQLTQLQQMTPYEKEYVCKDGSRLPMLVGGVILPFDPSHTIYFVLDNSARRELEQRKDDFINMASHELRTPLTALKIQTQIVRKRLERQSHHEAATALSRLEVPIKQMERLIGELLDVSKIQAGKLEYRQETVDLDELLDEVTDTLQAIHPDHTILVRNAVQVSLIGDRDRLGQVFTNLINNAIKYSPNAKTVDVDLDASEEAVTIHVRDHGLGIPREQRDKIFERCYRGPGQRGIPGLGMGLYIVAEIVKHHGGTISVESDVGKGSTFTVTFPMRRET